MSTISRRSFVKGITASGLVIASGAAFDSRAWASSSPSLFSQPGPSDAVPAQQIHIQYGADPASQMTVSWYTANSVANPRVRLGTPGRGFGLEIPAETKSYVDGINGVETICHHSRITGLAPGTSYVYEILCDGDTTGPYTFKTAPVGRQAFRFTSVGDLATPNTAWSKSSYNAAVTVAQVQQFNPLFHLHNGDLSYANDNESSQPEVWTDFMENIQTAATHIPWMTALGNHESEWANGPLGYASYQTRFAPPTDGSTNPQWQGNWYSFQVGSVFFVSLDANDVVYANDGSANPADKTESLYISGYSDGAQSLWLERTLAGASMDPSVDWIVVFFHQPIISSSTTGSGGDLGIRRGFLPAFDRYGVDLVLVGHDHDYERSYTVQGTDTDILRPHVVSTDTSNIDSSLGAVHMVIGGGGTSSHDDVYGADTVGNNPIYGGDPIALVYLDTPADKVYKATATGSEIGTWSAVRDPDTTHPWGMATFDVDPGAYPGAQTSITVNFWHTAAASSPTDRPDSEIFDSFTLAKRRRDGIGFFQTGREKVVVAG